MGRPPPGSATASTLARSLSDLGGLVARHEDSRGRMELGERGGGSRGQGASPVLAAGPGGEGREEPGAPGPERRRGTCRAHGEAKAPRRRGGGAPGWRGSPEGSADGRAGRVLDRHAGPRGQRILLAVRKSAASADSGGRDRSSLV